MDDLRSLVVRARDGDVEAFGDVVRQFQQIAVRYARSILGRRDLAEDAVQEAFVQAYLSLPRLSEPSAFPVWFRAIVHHSSHRLIRGKRPQFFSLEDAANVASTQPDPVELAEARDMARRVMRAVRRLPEHERDVVGLFYFAG